MRLYPSALQGLGVVFVNGKSNAGPNPGACRDTLSIAPGSLAPCSARNVYVWQLTKAGYLSLPVPVGAELARLTSQVAENNGFLSSRRHHEDHEVMEFLRRRIRHVIYVVADFWLFKDWEREFDQHVRDRNLPALEFVRLPHDHFGDFAAAIDGVDTPDTQMADNDYFTREDALDEERFNQALWQGLMGARPFPTTRHGRDLSRDRPRLLRDAAAAPLPSPSY